jgi:hypothetical protein
MLSEEKSDCEAQSCKSVLLRHLIHTPELALCTGGTYFPIPERIGHSVSLMSVPVSGAGVPVYANTSAFSAIRLQNSLFTAEKIQANAPAGADPVHANRHGTPVQQRNHIQSKIYLFTDFVKQNKTPAHMPRAVSG